MTSSNANLNTFAPEIFRKRLLIEGYFTIDVNEQTLIDFFRFITNNLSLATYADPIIHAPSGKGKEINQGYDAFVPLIDSGIYIAVWSNVKFLSLIIFTCKDFDDAKALKLVESFFKLNESIDKLF